MQTGTCPPQCPSDQMSNAGTMSMPMVNGNNVPISGIPPPVMIQQQQQQQQINNNPGQHQILNPTAISQGQLPIVPDGTQQFCLRWNSYPATVATQLAILRASEDFVDVTLACEGRQLRAHKLVLAACSPYFMELFKSTPCKHPVIFLRDVGFRQLVALLEFMYAGEVNVSQTELPTLLRTAEALQVRGLADTNTNNNSINDNNNYQQQIPPKNIFTPPQQHYSTPPVMVQQQHQGFPSVSAQSDQTSAVPQQQTMVTPSQPQATITNQAQHQLDNLQQQQQQQSSDNAMQSTSSVSSNQSKSHKRRKSSMSSQACRDAEDSSSDSNYSPETFTELKPVPKAVENIEHSMDLPSNLNSTANPIEMTNSSNRATGSIGQAEQNRQDSLMEFDGIGNLGGSQSEEETSEEEDLDDDEDDGEINEFSDGSYNLDPNDEGDTGMIPGTSDGNSGAAPLGIKNPELGSKDEAAIADKVQRSRLSRSLWPPGLPYHGPQQCPYCPRVLSNVGNWRKHVVTMHFAREKTYKCKHCNSSFRTAEYLQKHYVRVHNYPPKMTRKKYVEQT